MKLVAVLALLLGAGTGHAASLLIEPYIGYHQGKNKIPDVLDSENKGPSFGGRVGVQQLGLQFGLDYMTGKWTDNQNPSNNVTPENLGVFVGYDFIVLVRAFAVYNFMAKQKLEANSASSKFDGGNGMKFGLGLKLLPLVHLNIEYMTAVYKKLDGNTLSQNMNNSTYGVSISIPFVY